MLSVNILNQSFHLGISETLEKQLLLEIHTRLGFANLGLPATCIENRTIENI